MTGLGNLNYRDNCGNIIMDGRIFQGLWQVITIYTGREPLDHDRMETFELLDQAIVNSLSLRFSHGICFL